MHSHSSRKKFGGQCSLPKFYDFSPNLDFLVLYGYEKNFFQNLGEDQKIKKRSLP